MVSSVIRKPVNLGGEGRNVPKDYLKLPNSYVVNLQPLSVCWAFSVHQWWSAPLSLIKGFIVKHQKTDWNGPEACYDLRTGARLHQITQLLV